MRVSNRYLIFKGTFLTAGACIAHNNGKPMAIAFKSLFTFT